MTTPRGWRSSFSAIGADVTRHDTNMLFVRVGEAQAPALGEVYAGARRVD
ncbi:hypothetical protein LNP25_17975 [Klebsiella variicola subsp. variicola]|nr:hypothetical protein [Klebsiella variicola subsp. variicola]